MKLLFIDFEVFYVRLIFYDSRVRGTIMWVLDLTCAPLLINICIWKCIVDTEVKFLSKLFRGGRVFCVRVLIPPWRYYIILRRVIRDLSPVNLFFARYWRDLSGCISPTRFTALEFVSSF